MVLTALELKGHFDTAITQLQAVLTSQREEIATLGQTKDETAKSLLALDARLIELHSDFVEFARRDAVPYTEQFRNNGKTLGQQFVESDQYKSMIEMKMRVSTPLQVTSILPTSRFALTSDTPGGAGVASPPVRVPGFINPPQADLRMRDLIPVQGTTQGSIEYVRTTGFYPVHTVLTAAAAAAATALVVDSVAGFFVGQLVIIGDTNESDYVSAINSGTKTLTLQTGVVGAQASGSKVVSRVVGATPQGGLKPTGEFTDFSLETEPVKTIATSVDVARQALDDVGQLRAFIDNQLTFEMGYTEEWNLLYGDGTAGELHGLLTDPDRQTYKWSDGQVQTPEASVSVPDTKIDALRRAITNVTMARYPADGVVIHPRDWEDFELMKGSDAHYIWLQLPNGNGGSSFFRYPVVVTDAINQGTALTGSFALGTALWDREQANVRASDQHGDNFKRNLVSLLAEERIAQTIFRPEAFVEVIFDAQPT